MYIFKINRGRTFENNVLSSISMSDASFTTAPIAHDKSIPSISSAFSSKIVSSNP